MISPQFNPFYFFGSVGEIRQDRFSIPSCSGPSCSFDNYPSLFGVPSSSMFFNFKIKRNRYPTFGKVTTSITVGVKVYSRKVGQYHKISSFLFLRLVLYSSQLNGVMMVTAGAFIVALYKTTITEGKSTCGALPAGKNYYWFIFTV